MNKRVVAGKNLFKESICYRLTITGGDVVLLRRLILILILIPFLEVLILIQAGKFLGIWPTLLLLLGMGTLGFVLLQSQGLSALKRIRSAIRSGEPPGDALLEGLLIFAGGFLLVVPGFLTDIAGLLLMLPSVRTKMRWWLLDLILQRLKTGVWFYL